MFVETKRSVGKNYLYTQIDKNLNFVGHIHNSFEFITVTEGTLDCMVYEKRYTLEVGKGMLIMPNHVHRYESKNSKSFLCVFSPDYVIDFYNDTKSSGFVSSFFDYTDCGEIDLLQNGKANKYLVRSALYRICASSFKHLSRGAWGGDAGNAAELEVKLIDYIRLNYDKGTSLKQMAADLGYNYSYLCDVFNRVFGCGFSKFVNRLKVEDAAELLRTTDYSIARISSYCGFNNIKTLNLQFRDIYGTTPTEFRRRATAKKEDE